MDEEPLELRRQLAAYKERISVDVVRARVHEVLLKMPGTIKNGRPVHGSALNRLTEMVLYILEESD